MTTTPHHALLYRTSSTEDVKAIVAALVKDEEVVTYSLPSVRIEDVRQITDRAQRLPTHAHQQLLVIDSPRFTHEAQNALLKLLEEPPITTRFCLFVRASTQLLPTVLSRCQLMATPLSQTKRAADSVLAVFLAASAADRLAFIANANKQKDDVWFSTMQLQLQDYVEVNQSAKTAAVAHLLQYLTIRGAAKKMLWEELALLLPVERR